MPPLIQDPFYLIRQEIQDMVNELQQKMSRFHGLTAANPERKTLAHNVQSGCDSVAWQLTELDTAVDKASVDPAKFNLTTEELASRRKWINNTRRQVEGMKETLRTAISAISQTPAHLPDNKYQTANEGFVRGEVEKQQLVMRQQDDQLEDIEAAAARIARVGKEIGQELEHQEKLLNELDEDVDTTQSRLRAAGKKMQEIIKKSGSTTQLAVIGFLIVLLIILVVLAFM